VTRRLVRDLDRLAARYGFEPATVTGGGHLRYRHVTGALVHAASSPSDRRARANLLAAFRRTARGVKAS
jgi:putative hemolysin